MEKVTIDKNELNIQALRQAIIMKEVLDKPVSLRKKRNLHK